MRFEFPSILSETKIFVFDDDNWQSNSSICSYFLYKAKREYGEGWGLDTALPTLMAGEYFASLATALRDSDDNTRNVSYKFATSVTPEDIEFAASVVYKEKSKKRQYFSMALRRLSSVYSKQYDRRFEEVSEKHDGSAKAIFEILRNNRSMDGVNQYALVSAIRSYAYDTNVKKSRRVKRLYLQYPAEFLGWTNDYDEARAIHTAWEAIHEVSRVYQAKNNLQGMLDRYTQHAMVKKLEQ